MKDTNKVLLLGLLVSGTMNVLFLMNPPSKQAEAERKASVESFTSVLNSAQECEKKLLDITLASQPAPAAAVRTISEETRPRPKRIPGETIPQYLKRTQCQ